MKKIGQNSVFYPKGWCFYILINFTLHIVTINTAVNNTKPQLTAREIEILKLIAEGHTSAEIAAVVSLSVETIKWYRKRLLQKTDSANSAEMIRKATEYGMI